MKYILKTNKLLINSKESSHGAFIYTGSPNEGEKNKGKLVVLLDFPEKTEDPKELGNILIKKIHKLYYKSNLTDQEAILENILEEVNENLPIITDIDNSWVKKFNALIAIVYRQEVYFTPLGNVSAWTTGNNKLINVFDYLESDIDKPSVNKIFTNILSGNIEPDQLLFFTTNAIFDYLSEDKIEKIIINNEPAGIILKLKELLHKVKNKNFCLVSIKLSKYVASSNKNKKTTSKTINNSKKSGININISPQESIDNLLKSRKKTKEILNKGKSSVDKKEEETQNLDIDETETTNKSQAELKSSSQTSLKKKKINLSIYTKKYFSTLKNIFVAIFSVFKKIRNKLKSKTKAKHKSPKKLNVELDSETKISSKKIIPPTPVSAKSIKKITSGKNIIIIAIILLLAFVGSILIINSQKKLKIEKAEYEKLLQNIDEKQEEYELLLIYNDSGQAKDKLEEISSLINQLPQRTEEQKAKYNEILDKFTETLNQTRKLNTIKEPEIMAELDFTPQKVIKYGNNLIAIGKDSKNLSSLNLKTKEIKNISPTEISYDNIQNFNKDENFIYGLKENDQVIKIDLENQNAEEVGITYHPNYQQADDLMVYGGRIYILDRNNNQIYKHNQGTTVFGKGEEWIQDGSDIQNAQTLTIDGNIYIATNTGNIQKFYTGNLIDFDMETIDPEVKNIDQIFTDTTINEIYFLDNNSKRIIVINKEGTLINQFYLPTLSTMTDFIVDGAAQKVYIQSGNKIISLSLN